MALNQLMSDGSVASLNVTAYQSVAARREVLDAQISILRTWVFRRNMLLAESVADADKAIAAMHKAADIGQAHLDRAVEL
jgi:hypothetical protein